VTDCRNCPNRDICSTPCPEVERILPRPKPQPPTVYLYGEELERIAPATQDCTRNVIPGGVLSPRQHLALQLLIDGYSIDSIAELLQASKYAVWHLLARAKSKLAKHFADTPHK
jgi:DNA-binding CsgD family transcriptional regulator